jgi:hypothetical protein
MFNVIENTVITQYQNSPRIVALIKAMDKFIDPAESFDEFCFQVFNIETAVTWGLDNIGKIIGLERGLRLEDGTLYYMADEEYRYMLYLKAACNLTDCSIPSINAFLQWLFEERGMIFVREKAPMVIEYIFEFELLPHERILLKPSGLIPKPTGVGFGMDEIIAGFAFGFYDDEKGLIEQFYRGFNQGIFSIEGV